MNTTQAVQLLAQLVNHDELRFLNARERDVLNQALTLLVELVKETNMPSSTEDSLEKP